MGGPAGVDDGIAVAFTPLDAGHALDVAARRYGLRGASAHRFETERDDTFLVVDGEARYVLKVAHPADSAELIDMQCSALSHVASHDPSLPVPRVVADVDGGAFSSTTGADGEPRLVRLLTYLPGGPLDYDRVTPHQRAAIGALLGRLSASLEDFDHPGADRSLAWDLQHLASLRDRLPLIEDPVARADVETELDHYDAVTGPALRQVRHQVVHNDLNVDNVVVDDAGWPCALLDFGDMVRSAVVADLAVAMAYAVEVHAVDPWARAYELAAGFHEVRPLDDAEAALLPHLVRARMAQRMLVNSWLASANPSNAHHTLRANGHAIAALRRLVTVEAPRSIPSVSSWGG